MRAMITMMLIFVASITSAQTFNFSCDPLPVPPQVTLSQAVTNAGWVINFDNGLAGELTNVNYPGYVVLNGSDGVVGLDTYAESWAVKLNGNYLTEDFEGYFSDVIDYVVAHSTNGSTDLHGVDIQPNVEESEDHAFSDSDELTDLLSSLEALDDYQVTTFSDDGETTITIVADYNGSTTEVILNYNLNDDGDITDIDVSGEGANGLTEVQAYFTNLVNNLPHYEVRTLVTQIQNSYYFRTQAYGYFGGVKGDSVGGTSIITIINNGDDSYGYNGWTIYSDGFIAGPNDEDEGPFDSFSLALEYIVNL